jgi:hypothetical protein
MSDLHRLAHRLVTVLSARDGAALAGPLALADIAERVLPYRSFRRVLELDCAEDAADRCRKEVSAGNPDLSLLHRLEGVTVRLNLQAIEERAIRSTAHASDAGVGREESATIVVTTELPIASHESVPEAEPLPTEELDQAGEVEPEPEPEPELEPEPEPELELEPEPEPEPAQEPEPNLPAEPESEELLADHLDLGPELESPGAGFTESAESEIEDPAPEEVVQEGPAAEAAGSSEPDPEDAPDPEPFADEDSAPVRRLSAELESLLALAAEFADEGDAPAEELFVGSRTPPAASHPAPPRCHHCAGSLPAGRPVRFCPHCGRNLVPLQCIRCRADLEPEWRHCVLCGHPTGDDSRFA